jgi:predicted 3-demethylubiquinone-9 3-methyltransferase (glyoxalase superfamily)
MHVADRALAETIRGATGDPSGSEGPSGATKQKRRTAMSIKSISPFLWFNTEAGDAAQYYLSLFPNTRILHTAYYGKGMPGPEGSVMVVDMEIVGQRVALLNGGPHYKLSPAFSFTVNCEDQAEIDRLWAALGDGGVYSQCGWLTDKFGLTWQINYAGWPELASGPKSQKVMAAMMTMQKIDIQTLKEAAAS